MTEVLNLNLDYSRPIKIAPDVYWIGFYDNQAGLHCNPYLIIDGDQAVVIDGGSRPHFPVVMMKILQTGLDPSAICALIYQHYDPDLCGSLPNFEDIIDRPDLKIISAGENNMFINHYSTSSRFYSLQELQNSFSFDSGRKLGFTMTPYSHSGGSFVTLDEKSGVLFTSDLFGSYGGKWDLFLDLGKNCHSCADYTACPEGKKYCPFPDIINFHQRVMTSERALKHSLEQISHLPFRMIAPQHGSIIHKPEKILTVARLLAELKGVGIDRILGDRPYECMGNLSALVERLAPHEA
ncbi:MAG: MBL fold metallo-hydrolase [Pseudomonadota bacterium]